MLLVYFTKVYGSTTNVPKSYRHHET